MELTEIVANDEGVVFTFNKEFSYVYPMNAAGVKGIEGTITVELGGMLRLLPQDNMSTKTVGNAQGFSFCKSIRFMGNIHMELSRTRYLFVGVYRFPRTRKRIIIGVKKVLPENCWYFMLSNLSPTDGFIYCKSREVLE